MMEATHSSKRIPPGQYHVQRLPILHEGPVPHIDLDTWSLRITGLVEREVKVNYEQIRMLPEKIVFCDIHCVTKWTLLNTAWEGVATRDVLSLAEVLPEAKFVMIYGENNYSTNLPLDVFLKEPNIFAYRYSGEELTPQSGWPLRLLMPSLYLWKSAKWVTGIELMAEDKPGFWESRGYHMLGDPWQEQRYAE